MDIENLLQQVDLVDLAEKAGAHFRHRSDRGGSANCPLHGGDNPGAFVVHIHDGKQLWCCHTRCNEAGGDAIDFMRRWKGLDFMDAVKELAALYRVDWKDLKFSQVDAAQEKARRIKGDLFKEAAHYYQSRLWGIGLGLRGLDYLRCRAFSEATIRSSGWGFSDGGKGLYKYLNAKKLDLGPAYDSGLLRRDNHDFTANQNGQAAGPNGYIVFPHVDGGRITYFSSRAVPPIPDPKDKSRNLPGSRQVYKTSLDGRTADNVIIVEGPADAESLRQLGFSSWALCGLGEMPEIEIGRLKKKKTIYLSPDNDLAGQDAINRVNGKVGKLATDLGPLTIITPGLPEGKDYNAWLQVGARADQVTELLTDGKTWLESRLQQAAYCPPSEIDDRLREIGLLLAALPETSRPRYYSLAQKTLNMTRRDITQLISQAIGLKDGHALGGIKDGQLCFVDRPLGNFVARITHELSMDNGQDPPIVRYSVVGQMANGMPLEPVDIPAEDFADLKWIPRFWGARPILFVSKGQYYEVSRAIQEVSQGEIKREKVYTYTGWSEVEGKRAFLSGSGALSMDGLKPDVRVELGQNNMHRYQLPTPPEDEALMKAARASLDFLKIGPRAITAPLWAAMYAAPLTGIAPSYFVLWVYGQTQSGKSTITHLALTHFGASFIEGRNYHAPMDWTSTATSLEGSMFSAKDIPLIIDDFAPQFASVSDSREMHKRAHYVIRSVGNRSSRGRSRADLSERTTRIPRGLVIATAENPLVGQSTVGRMLYVGVDRGDIFPLDNGQVNQALGAAQELAQAGVYSQAMSAYIQYLAKNWEAISEQLPELIDMGSAYVRKCCPELQNRLPDYYGLLNAAQKTALRAFQNMGLISGVEAAREAELNSQALLELVQQQAARVASESPVKKFLEALNSLLERKKVYLSPSTKCDVEYNPPPHADPIGWYNPRDINEVYLSTENCLMHAKAFWSDLDENLDILPDALRRQIAQCGILTNRDKDHVEVVKWLWGKSRRVLSIDGQKLEELYGFTLSNEPSSMTKIGEQPPEPEMEGVL